MSIPQYGQSLNFFPVLVVAGPVPDAGAVSLPAIITGCPVRFIIGDG